MANRMNMNPVLTENLLSISWHDSNSIPTLNTANIMDYFADRSNPFYDRTCNNEIIKMQRLNPEHLQNMTGLEYVLLHVQEPILYVVRKQHRHGPQQVTPIADYYVNAGVIYQAPDLASVLNSRLLSMVHHLQTAFDETSSFVRYHPNKGYSWDFKTPTATDKTGKSTDTDASSSAANGAISSALSSSSGSLTNSKSSANKEEQASSHFQRQRVHMLLMELTKKFPVPPQIPFAVPAQTTTTTATATLPTTTTTTTAATTATTASPITTTTTSTLATSISTVSTTTISAVSTALPSTTANTPIKSELDSTTDIKCEKKFSPPEKKIKLSSSS